MKPKTTRIELSDVKRNWHLVDMNGQVLGRTATKIALLLSGKDKPTYTPSVDGGDGVVVINAAKLKVTGNKLQQKTYQRYSGYPGGLKKEPLGRLLGRKPTEVIRHAVNGMLPKNKLGRQQIRRLKIYTDDVHPHKAQVTA